MALRVKMTDPAGKGGSEVELNEAIFGAKPRKHLLFDAVTMQLACERQGTAKTRTRGEVRGGGKKPYNQKGSGNARMGTTRTPLAVGGGRTFGPTPRDYSYKLPRQVHREALRVALSQKTKEGKIFIIDGMPMKEPKTKKVAELLVRLKVKKALVVDEKNPLLAKSVANVRAAKYLEAAGLNVYDILKYDNLIFTSAALKALETRLA